MGAKVAEKKCESLVRDRKDRKYLGCLVECNLGIYVTLMKAGNGRELAVVLSQPKKFKLAFGSGSAALRVGA